MAAALVAAVVDYMQNDDVYALTNRTAYTPLPPSIAIPLITSKGRGGHHPPAPPTVYLAAPLFTLAERQHNTELTRELTRRFKGEVTFILPQEMTTDPQVDYESIAKTNLEALAGANVVLACLDGVDVDSGTSFEAGYARSKGKPILAYRTDLRLGEADGVNAMLRYACTKYIQFSALDTTLDRLADELAEQLSQPEMLDRPWKADVTPV
jgi:nucleoside 2-deoxyribosyltransferase